MDNDEQAIRKVMETWREATLRGDLPSVMELMTDDAVFLTAGNPPMTREAFAAAFRGFAGKMSVESRQEVNEIVVSGTLAYAWTFIAVKMTNTQSGAVTQRSGHVLTVFRRSPAGAWQLARDANLLGAPSGQHG